MSEQEVAILRRLAATFSIEVTPRDWARHHQVLRAVPAGTRVYITFLPAASFADTLDVVRAATERGLVPIPHLAARNLVDDAHADRVVGRLAAAGAREMLVIAGSLSRPAGTISESLQVLRSGVLQRHGITRVGVAGHPEGSPDIDDATLVETVRQKNAVAAETGLQLYLLTQFLFDPVPVIAWERRMRGLGNRLPVHVGLPGLASPVTLLKYGISCGIGPSLTVLRKQTGNVLTLATRTAYHPDETMLGVAQAMAADPAALFAGVHFFPFGAVRKTVDWLGRLATGSFTLQGNEIVVR